MEKLEEKWKEKEKQSALKGLCFLAGILTTIGIYNVFEKNILEEKYSPTETKIEDINNDGVKDLAMRTNKGYVLFYGVKDEEIPNEILDSLMGKKAIIRKKQQQLIQERNEIIKRINENYEKSLENLAK